MCQALIQIPRTWKREKKKKSYYSIMKTKKQVLVAHACNSSYSGGTDQEDRGSKSALGKEHTRPYLKKNLSQKQNRAS
jgi:hypothetical protein